MKLITPPKQNRLAPLVIRETPDLATAFVLHAASSGVSTCEALRQIVAHYNAKPWRFKKERTPGTKSARWGYYASHRSQKDALAVFQKHATKHGVSWAEALRQCVRKHLAEQGRAS